MENVEKRIKELFVKLFDMKPEEVTLKANLNGDLGMDSTEMVELIVALEKEFKIGIEDGEITNKHCVSDVVRIVEDKLKQ
ncbi:Acyl carrier protein [Candidatus Methanoperedenaceae archaeon GB50]|nr:MAG: acyl carrier protein [Thermodesulfobacteriota bacterium]CAD7776962.1 Acyl carrier protein [Candidatus Methanoperedenaceae archaeon GB50]